MSSIMKGIVDENDSSPYQEGYKAWKDYLAGKTKQRPVNPYPAGKGMGAWEQGAGDAAEHIDWGEGPLRETEAKKGADGKRCWKGKRYAGTENGKDKCIPVKEESETKWEVAIEYGPTANHTVKIKVSAPDEDTAQTKALALFKKKYPDRRGMVGDCTKLDEAANPAQQAAIAIAKKKKAKTNEESDEEALARLKKNKSREKWMADADLEYMHKRHAKKKKDETNEGVIVGHDANDPEVAILGGAGTMSLSRLKKKAQGEAEQLANDLARGRFKAAAYNIRQLENTLKTIAAAEDEMSKKYFGENAWNQLGQRKPNTNLPAPERGSRVNHGKRFEEGDIVLPLSGPLKGQPHKVIHSQRTSIRIVPLGRDSYPGDTIAPRTKHEWVVPADTNEDHTGEFAAEKTSETNPYGGQEDRQFRGVISETPTDNPTGTSTEGVWRRTDLDEYREMSPALKAAQQNLIALRNKEKATSVPGKRERAPRDRVELDKPKPASVLTKGAQEVDPDTMDAIAAFLAKGGEIKKGRPGKAPPTGRQQASKHIGGGGKYRKKSDTPGQGANYRGAAIVAVEEDTAYAGGMGQGGNAGESYRKFKPKSAGTFKESAILKGIKDRLD